MTGSQAHRLDQQAGHQTAVDGRHGHPDEWRNRMVVPDERTGEQLPVVELGHKMCFHKPRGCLEPDPVFAAIGDLPSGYLLRRRLRLQPQTENTTPDELTAATSHVFERGTKPLLRRSLCGSVGRHGENVDVIGTIHTAEGTDRLGDGALLEHGKHDLHLSSGSSCGCIAASIARIGSWKASMACRGRIITRNSTM